MCGRENTPIGEVRADGVDPELVEWRKELSSHLNRPLPLSKMFGRNRAPIEEVRAEWVESELVEWKKDHDRARSFKDDDQFLEKPQLHQVRDSCIFMPPPPVPPLRHYGTPLGPRRWQPDTHSSDPYRRAGSAPIDRPAITHLTPRRDHAPHPQQYPHSLEPYGSPEKSWPHNMQQTGASAFVPSTDAPIFAPVSYQQHVVPENANPDLATRRAQRAAIQSSQNSIALLSSDLGKRSKAVPIVKPSEAHLGEAEGLQETRKSEVSKQPRFSMDSVIFVPANWDHNSQTPEMPENQDANNAGDLQKPTGSVILSPVDAKVFSESAVLSNDDLEGSGAGGSEHEARVIVLAEALGSLSMESPTKLQPNVLEISGAAEGAEKVSFENSGSGKHHATVEDPEK